MTADDRTAATVATGDEPFVIVRDFAAPPARVFAAWTEPEQFARWWSPQPFTVPTCEIDLRPGGKLRYCMRSPEGREFWSGGTYLEVVPPERLVYVDYFADADGNPIDPTSYGMTPEWPRELTVTVTFEAIDGGTRLTVSDEVPRRVAEENGAVEGFGQTLDQLAVLLG